MTRLLSYIICFFYLTGELIGYEYLLNQSITLPENSEDEEAGETEDGAMEQELIMEHRAFTDGIDDDTLLEYPFCEVSVIISIVLPFHI